MRWVCFVCGAVPEINPLLGQIAKVGVGFGLATTGSPSAPCPGNRRPSTRDASTTTFILFSHRPIFRRYIISADGKTATKGPIAEKKPLWYQQGCLFEEVIDEGQKSWTFTIRQAKYDDAHLFLGVADATGDGMAWAFSPTTGSLYFHADLHKWGKETKTRIMPGDALFGRKDGPPGHKSAQYVGEPTGAEDPNEPTRIPAMIDATVKCIVDMDKQALSFQINDGEIVELSQRDCELPEEVQPWILLGHPGDEVEISDVVDVC